MEIKSIKDPAKFLIDSGLLFEINRSVLHPFGLAMAVYPDGKEPGSDEGVIQIYDDRDDKEGTLFGDEAFMLGMAKFEKFLEEFGIDKIQQRKEILGYVQQFFPNPYLVKDGVTIFKRNPDYDKQVEDSPEAILFTVPYKWLEDRTVQWFNLTVEEFVVSYSYEMSDVVYQDAKIAGVATNEEFVKHGLPDEVE